MTYGDIVLATLVAVGVLLFIILSITPLAVKDMVSPDTDGATPNTFAFEEYAKTCRTGDIFIFSGSNGIVRFFDESPWTHVGMVIRHPELPTEPMWWEANLEGDRVLNHPPIDVLKLKEGGGSQLLLLRDKLKQAKANWVCRPLLAPPHFTEQERFNRVWPLVLESSRWKFGNSILFWCWCAAVQKGHVPVPPPLWVLGDSVDTGVVFCSQLVGYGLAALGALSLEKVDARLLLPSDFAVKRKYNVVEEGMCKLLSVTGYESTIRPEDRWINRELGWKLGTAFYVSL